MTRMRPTSLLACCNWLLKPAFPVMRLGRLIALRKPNGRIRGFAAEAKAAGDLFRRHWPERPSGQDIRLIGRMVGSFVARYRFPGGASRGERAQTLTFSLLVLAGPTQVWWPWPTQMWARSRRPRRSLRVFFLFFFLARLFSPPAG